MIEELKVEKIKGIFVLSDILYRELGYSVENLFGETYTSNKGDEHIVLDIQGYFIRGEQNWLAEVSRETFSEDKQEFGYDVDHNVEQLSFENIHYLVESLKSKFDRNTAKCWVKIFRNKKNGYWVAQIYADFVDDYDCDYDHDCEYESYEEEVSYKIDFDDSPERAESISLTGVLERLERVLEAKIYDN